MRGRDIRWIGFDREYNRPFGSSPELVKSGILRAALVCIGLSFILSSVGCAADNNNGHHTRSDKAILPSITDLKISNASILDSWYPATGAEFTTGAGYEAAVAVLISKKNVQCMAAHGYRYSGISFQAARQSFMGDNDQFPDLTWIARNKLFLPNGGIGPARSTYSPAMTAELQNCSLSSRAQVVKLAGPTGLSYEWDQIFTKIQSSAVVQRKMRDFGQCLSPFGVPPDAAQDFRHFLAWETGLQTYHESKASVVAIQHHWAPIFVRCAGPVVKFEESLQLAARRVFLAKHSKEIRTALNLALASMIHAG